MFTVKMESENSDCNRIEVWECENYKKMCSKEDHILSLYGVTGSVTPIHIDLRTLPEDKGGVYSRNIYIMNDAGQTVEKWSW